MDFNVIITIVLFLFGGLFGVLGYFLREVIRDVKKNTELNSEQEGRLDSMDKVHKLDIQSIKDLQNNKVDNLREITELQITKLTENIQSLTTSLNKHIEITERRVEQVDKSNEVLLSLVRKISEKQD